MNKKVALSLIALLVLSVFIVAILYWLSGYVTHQHNQFVRVFPPHPIIEAGTLDLEHNSYYVAGAAKDRLYLGNYSAPLHLLETKMDLSDTNHVKVGIENFAKYKFRFVNVKVDSPLFYISDGELPGIFKGRVGEWLAKKITYDSAYFHESVPIGQGSFLLRSLSGRTNKYAIAKLQADTPHVVLNHDLLQAQIDGIFCVDGHLNYNRELGQLTYVYYYRNEFIVADSSLNLRYRGHTIDTNRHAKINVRVAGKKKVLGSPPMTVNKRSCTSGQFLFVQSNLLARNERRELFENSSVIDVYDLTKGTYSFSFYIPDLFKEKIWDFKVVGPNLIVLSGQHLRLYTLQPFYFSKVFKGSNAGN